MRSPREIMSHSIETTLTVNGTPTTRRIEPRQHLIDFLREDLGLTGSHTACEHGVCGACTVRVDGKIVRGCLMLAVQAAGCRVDTIEGLSDSGELAELQRAFHERNALQCGFCTPGIARARVKSSFLMCACACGLRKNTTCASRGKRKSSV